MKKNNKFLIGFEKKMFFALISLALSIYLIQKNPYHFAACQIRALVI